MERTHDRAGGASAEARAARKKVTILVGSLHKGGATHTAARKLLEGLESFGDVEGEIVLLGDHDLGLCRGCKLCFDRGEENCPLEGDRDLLLGKMLASDGVVFTSPNYAWHVSGVMKLFLDRIAFVFHRPMFHGRAATSVVVQGIGLGGRVRKYLDFCAAGLGFRVVKGTVHRTLLPMTEKAVRAMDASLAEQGRRFHAELLRPAYPPPSLLELMWFRMGRTGIRANAPRDMRDYAYYGEQGWFASDYFYPVRLGPFKKAAGALFDWLAARMPAFKVSQDKGKEEPPPAASSPR